MKKMVKKHALLHAELRVLHDTSQYTLSGGSQCTVVRRKGASSYLAFIHMEPTGRYPEMGNVARNFNRTEYIYVNRGSADIHLNNQFIHMQEGESIFVDNGDIYALTAHDAGIDCTVLVTDGTNAESVIMQV